MNAAGIVLAGGLARRMGGGDKSLRLLNGRPILDHVIARLAPQVPMLAINANGDPARFSAWGLPVIPDIMADNPGPLAGVLTGMRWASAAGLRDIVTVPADTPFIPTTLVMQLHEARIRDAAGIAIAVSDGRDHPVIALWSVTLAARLDHALRIEGTRQVRAFLDRQRIARAHFPSLPFDPFFNINCPGDIDVATRLAEQIG